MNVLDDLIEGVKGASLRARNSYGVEIENFFHAHDRTGICYFITRLKPTKDKDLLIFLSFTTAMGKSITLLGLSVHPVALSSEQGDPLTKMFKIQALPQ